MNCAHFEEQALSDEPLCASAQTHRRHCVRCDEFQRQLEMLDRQLKAALPGPALPEGFDQTLAARLASATAGPTNELSLKRLLDEDTHRWQQLSHRTWKHLVGVALDSLGIVSVITVVLVALSLRLREHLPSQALTSSVPFSPLQIAVFLGCAAFCMTSSLWSWQEFRRRI